MNEEEAYWNCGKCSTKNWVRYDPEKLKEKIFACVNCGKVHQKFKVRASDKNWLDCIPFKGLGDKLPGGVSIEHGTDDKFYGDPQGGPDLTRAQYGRKYGYDPWFLFCNQTRNKDHPVCEGFEKRREDPMGDMEVKIINTTSTNPNLPSS